MFTGIVQATGEVVSFAAGVEGASRLTMKMGEQIAGRLRRGDSIAVSGVCLTALEIGPDRFTADLAAETIARTTLSSLGTGSIVNLELPTPAGAPLGGHVVQGHVDGVGTVLALDERGAGAEWVLRVRVPDDLSRYIVAKGSIAVEGISLTVAGVGGDEIWIAILPHTYATTNMRTLQEGAHVNLEVDVLAKYAERAKAESRGSELTLGYLLASGY